jgi:hypothetical protein
VRQFLDLGLGISDVSQVQRVVGTKLTAYPQPVSVARRPYEDHRIGTRVFGGDNYGEPNGARPYYNAGIASPEAGEIDGMLGSGDGLNGYPGPPGNPFVELVNARFLGYVEIL